MRIIPLLSLLVFFSTSSVGQDECPEIRDIPFIENEVLRYELIYHWGLLWIPAGKVQFSTKDSLINGQNSMIFQGYGKSLSSWDWFYKVRSEYVSVTDRNMLPKSFIRRGQEGSHSYNDFYDFSGDSIVCNLKDNDITKRIALADSGCSLDVISAIYYCRCLDFENFEIDSIFPFNIILDGVSHPSYIHFIGEEEIEIKETKKTETCYVFKPMLIEGTIFHKGENMTVYVTKEKRVPVYVETELLVGKAKVYLVGGNY